MIIAGYTQPRKQYIQLMLGVQSRILRREGMEPMHDRTPVDLMVGLELIQVAAEGSGEGVTDEDDFLPLGRLHDFLHFQQRHVRKVLDYLDEKNIAGEMSMRARMESRTNKHGATAPWREPC